jgi:hypothetical protein
MSFGGSPLGGVPFGGSLGTSPTLATKLTDGVGRTTVKPVFRNPPSGFLELENGTFLLFENGGRVGLDVNYLSESGVTSISRN